MSKVTGVRFEQPHPPPRSLKARTTCCWPPIGGENGMLYAVGDSALLRARSGELSFSEYGYQGRTPTAFQFNGGAVLPVPFRL